MERSTQQRINALRGWAKTRPTRRHRPCARKVGPAGDEWWERQVDPDRVLPERERQRQGGRGETGALPRTRAEIRGVAAVHVRAAVRESVGAGCRPICSIRSTSMRASCSTGPSRTCRAGGMWSRSMRRCGATGPRSWSPISSTAGVADASVVVDQLDTFTPRRGHDVDLGEVEELLLARSRQYGGAAVIYDPAGMWQMAQRLTGVGLCDRAHVHRVVELSADVVVVAGRARAPVEDRARRRSRRRDVERPGAGGRTEPVPDGSRPVEAR